MDFLKIKDYWTYQLPEWDNHEKEILEKILSQLDYVSILGYIMAPEADIWKVEYNGHEFRIKSDLVYGCEIQTRDEEALPIMQELIQKLPLE